MLDSNRSLPVPDCFWVLQAGQALFPTASLDKQGSHTQKSTPCPENPSKGTRIDFAKKFAKLAKPFKISWGFLHTMMAT